MARNKKARAGFVKTQNKKAQAAAVKAKAKRDEAEVARLLKEQEARAAEAGRLRRAQKRAPGEELL